MAKWNCSRFAHCLVFVVAAWVAASVVGQESTVSSKPIVLQRRQVVLTPAEAYRVLLRLEPSRSVTIYAPFDAVVKSVVEKLEGRAVDDQFELLRLDNQRLDLVTRRAVAAKTVADNEMRIARSSNNVDQVKLAEAKVALAEAEVALSVHDQGAASIRAPYAGNVMRVHVQDGQQVRAGQPLVTFGDLKRLRCRIPVDREVVKVGSTLDLAVEATVLKAVVETVSVLDPDHDKLRELAVSAATAVVVIENNFGELHPGQIAYGPLSPSGSVASVPLAAVRTSASGDRVVPVHREGVIRLLPVSLHGQVGRESIFVSGQFTERDEFILSSTIELVDGMTVRPSAQGGNVATQGAGSATASGGAKSLPGSDSKSVPNTPKKPGAGGF